MQSLPPFIKVPLPVKTFLFACGFGILSLEILGVKVLAPYVGAAMPVWGAVIGTTLLGGMFGYYGGGAVADRTQSSKIMLLLATSAGAFTMATPLLKFGLSMTTSLSPAIGGFIGAMVLLLIPVTLLSASIIFVIRVYVRGLDTIAQVHGDLYAIATIGSITGVFLTSYVLVPNFSVSLIFYGLGVAIILLSIFLLRCVPQN